MRGVATLFLAAGLAALPTLALASSNGEIACQNEVTQLQNRLNAQAGQMDPNRTQDVQKRLNIANEQCPQGLNFAQTQLSQVRRELNEPQTAQVPGEEAPATH